MFFSKFKFVFSLNFFFLNFFLNFLLNRVQFCHQFVDEAFILRDISFQILDSNHWFLAIDHVFFQKAAIALDFWVSPQIGSINFNSN